MTRKWKTTGLWHLLKRRTKSQSAAHTREFLLSCMDNIELVLAKGGTAQVDFTLHDEDHSFRVAQRMADLIPEKVLAKLSGYEVGLLLLSAYLHDIGMTPERRKVSGIYTYLLTGVAGTLTNEECDEVEAWMDEEGYDVDPPIAKGAPSPTDLQLAAEVTSSFSRHKHNAWSKEWITDHLTSASWAGYVHWMDDLIDLCQSHHWGYEGLTREELDPRLLHSGDVVNLRYLACVLRMADIMENDPERTPEVIFTHRGIEPESRVYWWRDQDLVVQLDKKKRFLSLRASPRNAVIHRAVLETAANIEKELRLCDRIASEMPFNQFPKHAPLPHEWDLPSSLWTDVRPYRNRYTYIEGAFRPDTQKILEILGGLELYGDEMYAVRELVQNAFDAVRETIAYERLAIADEGNPADPKWLLELGNKHQVTISLKTEVNNQVWLICKDDGIGMTKGIIENYLLVSGSTRRRDVLALERGCRRKNFSSERTGKFGIGVLSYFMIADEVEITTRRSQLAGDADGESWIFRSSGVGQFGELSHTDAGAPGTEVRLRLNPESAIMLEYRLLPFIRQQVTWSPCRLTVEDGTSTNSYTAGWTTQQKPELSGLEPELVAKIAIQAEEGYLPHGLGRYRIHIPRFHLPSGMSFSYFREKIDHGTLKILSIRKRDCLTMPGGCSTSYKGMLVEEAPGMKPRVALVDIDWSLAEAGTISVNRKTFMPSSKAKAAMEFIEARERMLLETLMKENHESIYNLYNQALTGVYCTENPVFNWLTLSDDDQGSWTWGPIKFPALFASTDLSYNLFFNMDIKSLYQLMRRFEDQEESDRVLFCGKLLKWNGNGLALVSGIERGTDWSYKTLFWDLTKYPPDRIVISNVAELGVLVSPLWIAPPRPHAAMFAACKYPATWTMVLAAQVTCGLILNIDHPLCEWEMLQEVLREAGSQENFLNEFCRRLENSQYDRLEVLPNMWRYLSDRKSNIDEVLLLQGTNIDDMVVKVVSKDGVRTEKDVWKILPEPDAESRIEFPLASSPPLPGSG